MRKYYSELFEAMHEDVLADFRKGRITEAELREFEEDAFIEEDVTNEVGELQDQKPLVTEHANA